MSRIVTNGDDWMRDVEKRLQREERRPAPASFADQLGPGITQRARAVADWNDPVNLRNGWYFSEPFSINSPDYDTGWLGETITTYDGRGLQRLSAIADDRRFQRHFWHVGNSPIPTFSTWQHTGGAPEPEFLSASNPAWWSSNGTQAWRDGNTVTINVNVTALANRPGNTLVHPLPLRYQPSALLTSFLYFWGMDGATGGQVALYVNYTGVHHVFDRLAGQTSLGVVTFVTPNPWSA
jgi:hypothetical protein